MSSPTHLSVFTSLGERPILVLSTFCSRFLTPFFPFNLQANLPYSQTSSSFPIPLSLSLSGNSSLQSLQRPTVAVKRRGVTS